ncbi:hypothetical protein CDAR_426251 [Caerostris darwini]|uniref:Uncharacterized protein n=1 Tax=Caerostris darwini TaxID=1538125 RepID=A0AAV4UKC3_9ARAC|nr:hypothetical protein CDAR_426251 [Caerostris darwini]
MTPLSGSKRTEEFINSLARGSFMVRGTAYIRSAKFSNVFSSNGNGNGITITALRADLCRANWGWLGGINGFERRMQGGGETNKPNKEGKAETEIFV